MTPPRTLARRSVLIVDDDEDTRDSLQAALTDPLPDVDVLLAADVTSAMRLLETQRVDVVLSDYHIGASDGVSFLADARRAHPDLRCALFTALPDEGLARRAKIEAGVERFFVKPIDLPGLTRGLRGLLAVG